jgi:serine/threonine protein kinase
MNIPNLAYDIEKKNVEFEEYTEQIKNLEKEIKKCDIEIKDCENESKLPGLLQSDKERFWRKEEQLRREKEQLRREKEQLRTKEEHLREERLMLMKQIDNERRSPSALRKDILIQHIQELLPGIKIKDSVIRMIKTNPDLYHQLHNASSWSKGQATEFINDVKLRLKTSTKAMITNTKSYQFIDTVSYVGQPGISIFKVANTCGAFCAKVGPLIQIKKEYDVGSIVVGPCVMPIVDYFDIPEERAFLISPLYQASLRDFVFNGVFYTDDKTCVSVLLCGLSAISSFASKSFCHSDIKMNNIMMETLIKFVFIDFGSATKFGSIINSTTAGISMTRENPTIGFDVSRFLLSLQYDH